MIYTVTVKPDYPAVINRQGRFVHVVAAATDIDLRFIGVKNGIDDRSVMRQGMAIELENTIDELVIESEVAQTVQIWLSETKLTYGLSETVQAGSRGLNNYQATVFKGEVSQILNAKPLRGRSIICSDVDIRVGGANLSNELSNGVLIKANESVTINTQAAIYAYTDIDGYEAVKMVGFDDEVTSARVHGSSFTMVGGVYSDSLDRLILGFNSEGFKTMLIDDINYGVQNNISAANFNCVGKNVFDDGISAVSLVMDGTAIKPININKSTLNVTLGNEIQATGGGKFWGETCSAISSNKKVITSVLRQAESDTFELCLSIDGSTYSVELLDSVNGAWPEDVVVRNNGDVFIFFEGGIIRRKINGVWDQVIASFEIVNNSNDEKLFNGNESYLFLLADKHRIYRSSDNGESWQQMLNLEKKQRFCRIEVVNSFLYIFSSYEGLFLYSADNADSFISSFGISSPLYMKVSKTFINASGAYIIPAAGDLIQVAGNIKKTGGAAVNVMAEEN